MTKSKGQLRKRVRGGIAPPTHLLDLKWDGCTMGLGLLDLTAPEGKYAIDSFAQTLGLASSWREQENSPKEDSLFQLRASIEVSAYAAAICAHEALEVLPRARALA